MRYALALGVVVLAAGCGGTNTVTVTKTLTHVQTVTVPAKTTGTTTTTSTTAAKAACAASSLQASFDLVPGSAGAGQVSYGLTLTNTGDASCYVEGIPQVQLLGTTGNALPTTSSAEPGQPAPQRITLGHGDSTSAEARFSPDVNGQGDNQTGRCQPTATVLRITPPGGGTIDAPVQPPTSVCEQGSLHWRPFVAGK